MRRRNRNFLSADLAATEKKFSRGKRVLYSPPKEPPVRVAFLRKEGLEPRGALREKMSCGHFFICKPGVTS